VTTATARSNTACLVASGEQFRRERDRLEPGVADRAKSEALGDRTQRRLTRLDERERAVADGPHPRLRDDTHTRIRECRRGVVAVLAREHGDGVGRGDGPFERLDVVCRVAQLRQLPR
jgi:hypothetical protein